MAERVSFEIWYADGDVRKGTTLEDWRAMSDDGVLVVVERMNAYYGHPRKQTGMRKAYTDYFWMDPKGEIGAGSAKEVPHQIVYIKRGTYVDQETWNRLYNAAMVDPEEGTL